MISHPNTMAAAIAGQRRQRLALHESLDALQQEADMCRRRFAPHPAHFVLVHALLHASLLISIGPRTQAIGQFQELSPADQPRTYRIYRHARGNPRQHRCNLDQFPRKLGSPHDRCNSRLHAKGGNCHHE